MNKQEEKRFNKLKNEEININKYTNKNVILKKMNPAYKFQNRFAQCVLFKKYYIEENIDSNIFKSSKANRNGLDKNSSNLYTSPENIKFKGNKAIYLSHD